MQGIDISAASRTETNGELMIRRFDSARSVTSAEKTVQDFVAAGLVILEPRCLGVLAPLAKWRSDNYPRSAGRSTGSAPTTRNRFAISASGSVTSDSNWIE